MYILNLNYNQLFFTFIIEFLKWISCCVTDRVQIQNMLLSPPRIIICGAPASGKGTQCEFIREEFKVVHLSTGDMLRAAVKAGSPLGAEAKGYMDRGELVPDSTMIGIIFDRLQEQDCVMNGWLLDGFPRTGAQADALINAGIMCDLLIQLDVTDSLLVERVVGRRSDPVTGKIYHLKYSPPENDEVAARLVHRSDDTEEKVLVRLAAYHKNLSSILDKYTDRTYRVVVKTNANSPSLYWRSIRDRIIRSLKSQVVFVLGGPGSGKGTQCKRISETFGYVHLSAGDLLRAEKDKPGELAASINKITLAGGIVPADITINLLAKAMMESGKKKFLIDGFPRNYENLIRWNEMMSDNCLLDFVLFLECDEATMTERLLDRSKTSGRADDNIETIRKRFVTFYTDTMPVLDSLKRMGKVRQVSSMLPPDLVYENAARLFRAVDAAPTYTRTFAIIKPDAVSLGHVPAILDTINSSGLAVVASKLVQMDNEAVGEFYHEHSNKSFFPSLRQFMCSGPSLVMVIEGVDAVGEWRKLLGPTSTQDAQKRSPFSIRARFGTDSTRNACHGSDSPTSSLREVDFWFGSSPAALRCELDKPKATITVVTAPAPEPPIVTKKGKKDKKADAKEPKAADKAKATTPKAAAATADVPAAPLRTSPIGLPTEDTFAMIKPGTADLYRNQINAVIALHGFEVVAETRARLTLGQTEAFYVEHRGKEFYAPLTQYMASAPIVALHLRREGAVRGWRQLIGPTNSEVAQAQKPESVRGLYGVDGQRNAVHGSDSSTSAQRELEFFFSFGTGGGQLKSLASSAETIKLTPGPQSGDTDTGAGSIPLVRHARKVHTLPTISRKDMMLMTDFAYREIDPMMQSLMQSLLIERPTNVAQFAAAELTHIAKEIENGTWSGDGMGVPHGVKLDPINGRHSTGSLRGGGSVGSADSMGGLHDDDLDSV